MAKKNRSAGANRGRFGPQIPVKAPTAPDHAADILELEAHLAEAALPEVVAEPSEAPASVEALNDFIKRAQNAEASFRQAVLALDQRQSEIETRERDLDGQADEAERIRESLQADRETNKQQVQELLKERERLELLRQDAAIGFLSSNSKLIDEMQVAAQESFDSLIGARTRHISALAEQADQTKERMLEFETSLEARLETLLTSLGDLSVREAELAAREYHLNTREQALDTLVARAVASQVADLRDRADDLAARNDALKAALAGRNSELATLRETAASATDVDRMSKENQRLREALAELREQASREGAAVTRAEYEAERTLRAQLEGDLLDARTQLAQESRRVQRYVTAEADLQLQYDRAQSLQAAADSYRALADSLRSDIAQLTQDASLDSPFSALDEIDRMPALEKISSSRTKLDKSWAERLQALLHQGSEGPEGYAGTGLNFDLDDLRAFIAGMASSKLIILQGISGTGKTSLPNAVARVIGANSEVVEVAASWREPQDLLGYFNSFEKKFHDTKALRFLYKASTPAARPLLHFLVLDEMNLSHPEHYFSDFLAAMERADGERSLPLHISAPGSARPVLLDGDGAIPLPENTWFVGTINRDETTVTIADKTYDRAHIMELPKRPPTLRGIAVQKPLANPLGHSELTKLFESAKAAYGSNAERVNDLLLKDLQEFVGNEFDIGWGNRLSKMVDSFVPVFVALGGSIGNAADQVMASKILRKLEGRFDLKEEPLLRLRDQVLPAALESVGVKFQDSHSERVLKPVIAKVQRGRE